MYTTPRWSRPQRILSSEEVQASGNVYAPSPPHILSYPISQYPIYTSQIYRTVLDHLTTSIFQMVVYFSDNKTSRGIPIRFSNFKTLTDRKLIDAYRFKDLRKPSVAIPPQPQIVTDFLKSIKLSQEDFVINYGRIFLIMSTAKAQDRALRLSPDLATRIFAMLGLYWTSDSKNRSRDWDKVASAVVSETALIATYREDMLKSCPQVRALRQELHDFFFGIAKPWHRLHQPTPDTPLEATPNKEWFFPDKIVITEEEATNDVHTSTDDVLPVDNPNQQDVQTMRRTHFQMLMSSKKKVVKKKTKQKDDPSTQPDLPDPDVAPDAAAATTTTTATSSTAAKDTTPHTRSEDIQSLLSSLKSIQKHKLLRCSDPDAPSGSTESIASFAVSIIGHVCIHTHLHLHLPLSYPLTSIPKVAYLNKARLEFEDKQDPSKKGKRKKKEFDMSTVTVPDLNLSAYAVSSQFRDDARTPLFHPLYPSNLPLF